MLLRQLKRSLSPSDATAMLAELLLLLIQDVQGQGR